MELNNYIKIIGKKFWFFLGTLIVIISATALFSLNKPSQWDASAMVNINKIGESQKEEFYQYDRYYSLSASSLFGDSLLSWLADPSFVTEVADQSAVDVKNLKLKKLSKVINAKKYPPASVLITYSSTDKEKANSFIKAVISKLEKKMADLRQNDQTNNFQLDFNQPIVVERQVSLAYNLLISLLTAIIVGLTLVFSLEYFCKK